MVQVYIQRNLDLYKQKLFLLNPKTGDREPSGYIRSFNTNCLQNIHTRYLIPLRIRSVIFILPV